MIFVAFLSIILAGCVSGAPWSNLNCPAPRSPENGLNYIFRDGDTVRYICHPGFQLIGVSVVHCVNNQWTHPPPDCYKIGRYGHPSNQILPEGTANYHNRRDQRNLRDLDRNRQLFNWEEQAASQQNVYGDGPKRLPLINGIWPPQDHANQVLALGPQSTPGPRALVREEIDIAELRNKQLEELKKRRYKATEGTGKRRQGRKKNKRKNSIFVDESIPRETILSLGSTEDGQVLSVAHAKSLNESTKPPHKHRHHHGEKKVGGTKKPRNYDPAGYSNNVIYSNTPRVAGGFAYYQPPYYQPPNYKPHHKSAANNNIFEMRRRPIGQVHNSNGSILNPIREQVPPTIRGGEYLNRRRPLVETAEPNRNITEQFDASCLEIIRRRQVPKIAPQIQNGFVYRYVSRKNEEYPFNSFMAVLYKCINDYVFVNNEQQTLYCKKGEWFGERPRCIKQPTIY